MTRLVRLGETSARDTRRRVSLAEPGDDGDTKEVLDTFIRQARALVVGEEGGDEVEIVHDALLREWSALVRWLDDDRAALRLRQDLAEAVVRHAAEANAEYLWGRGRLEEAQRLLSASAVELNASERNFLADSGRVVQAQHRLRGRRGGDRQRGWNRSPLGPPHGDAHRHVARTRRQRDRRRVRSRRATDRLRRS